MLPQPVSSSMSVLHPRACKRTRLKMSTCCVGVRSKGKLFGGANVLTCVYQAMCWLSLLLLVYIVPVHKSVPLNGALSLSQWNPSHQAQQPQLGVQHKSVSSDGTNPCSVQRCLVDNIRFEQMPCSTVSKLNTCFRSIPMKECRGNLGYHTSMVYLKQAKKRCRNSSSPAPHHSGNGGPPVRSGDSFALYQQLAKHSSRPMAASQRAQQAPPLYHPRSSFNRGQFTSKPEYFQYCLSAAYNYTIGVDITPSVFVSSPSNKLAPSYASAASDDDEEDEHNSDDDQIWSHGRPRERKFKRIRAKSRARRQVLPPHPDLSQVSANTGAQSSPYSHQSRQLMSDQRLLMPSYQRSFDLLQQSPIISHSQQRNNRHQGPPPPLLPSPVSQSEQSSMVYKPVQPMTPSLTCIIFGDPHIRTFDSRYQTCNCLGARSLIEHPLFDVQITNTRLQDQFNATGVTKVTVLVRKFGPCSIGNELIYETDSLAQSIPAATFTDGSVFNFNNLIYVSTSSQSKVVTIHLEHIGVRVYISQFEQTKFLNVVIKFRTATSTVKQNLVLNAISPISLCKSGCHPRELVDIEKVLNDAGIGTSVSGDTGAAASVGSKSQEQKVHFSRDEDDGDTGDEDEDEFDDIDENDDDDDVSSRNRNLRISSSLDETDEEYGDEYTETGDEEVDEDTGLYYDDSTNYHHLSRSKKDVSNSETGRSGGRRNKKKNRNKTAKNNSTTESSSVSPVASTTTTTASTTTTTTERSNGRKGNKNRKKNNRNNSSATKSKAANHKKSAEIPLHVLSSMSLLSSSSEIDTRSLADDMPYSPVDNDPSSPLVMPQNECSKMIGYYRLTCLYDTLLKGIVSTDPHEFAGSFDEPRFMSSGTMTPTVNTKISQHSKTISSSSSSSWRMTVGLSHLLLCLLLSLLSCSVWINQVNPYCL